jgi:hypothetical protein
MLTIPNDQFFALVEKSIASGEHVDIRVRGSSMYPALVDNGHRVVLAPYDPAHRRIGMIALIRYGGRHVLHRLVSVRGDVFVFRGDNLPHTVEKVGEGDIVAFVRRIIDPRGEETDCLGWRFAVASRMQAMVAKPRSILSARVASMRVRLGRPPFKTTAPCERE